MSIIRSGTRIGRLNRLNSAFRKPKSNGALCAISLAVTEERQHVLDDLGETRLVRQMRQREAMNARRVLRDVPVRMDQRMKVFACRQVVQQFQCRNLDHPMPEMRLQARGLRVEQNRPRHARTSLISRLSAFSE